MILTWGHNLNQNFKNCILNNSKTLTYILGKKKLFETPADFGQISARGLEFWSGAWAGLSQSLQ